MNGLTGLNPFMLQQQDNSEATAGLGSALEGQQQEQAGGMMSPDIWSNLAAIVISDQMGQSALAPKLLESGPALSMLAPRMGEGGGLDKMAMGRLIDEGMPSIMKFLGGF